MVGLGILGYLNKATVVGRGRMQGRMGMLVVGGTGMCCCVVCDVCSLQCKHRG